MNDEQRRKLYEEVRRLHDPKYLEQQRREKTIRQAETYFRRREIEKERLAKLKAKKQPILDEMARLRGEIKWREEWRKQMVEKMKSGVEEWLFNSLSHLEDKMWEDIGELDDMIEKEKEKLKTI